MKTDDLINALSNDASVRWPLGRAMTVAVLAGATAVAVLFFSLLGFRPDIASAAETSRFAFKIVLTLLLTIAALGITQRLARPEASAGAWRWALSTIPALLIAGLAAEMAAMPRVTWMSRLVGHNWLHCLTLIPLLAAVPLACLLLALRQGAPTRPGVAGALAGLVASGIAAMFYATNCTDDSPLFVAVWYPLATAIVTSIGYLVGRRLLRW